MGGSKNCTRKLFYGSRAAPIAIRFEMVVPAEMRVEKCNQQRCFRDSDLNLGSHDTLRRRPCSTLNERHSLTVLGRAFRPPHELCPINQVSLSGEVDFEGDPKQRKTNTSTGASLFSCTCWWQLVLSCLLVETHFGMRPGEHRLCGVILPRVCEHLAPSS